jgi:hypothetical protein
MSLHAPLSPSLLVCALPRMCLLQLGLYTQSLGRAVERKQLEIKKPLEIRNSRVARVRGKSLISTLLRQ